MSGYESEDTEPTSERYAKTTPKVWIASVSDYDKGDLHGAWVSTNQKPEGIWAGIDGVLSASRQGLPQWWRALRASRQPNPEEWLVFAYEGFGPIELSEHETVERLSSLGLGIAEHGEAFAAFAAHFTEVGGANLRLGYEQTYLGRYESIATYVERLLRGSVPQRLQRFVEFDISGLTRPLETDGSLLALRASHGGVFLFQTPSWPE